MNFIKIRSPYPLWREGFKAVSIYKIFIIQLFLNKYSSLSLVPESAAPEDFPDCLNLKKSQKLERALSSTLSA